MNEYADPGSMAVIVFDNSQIEIVAQHSITQDGEYINKADLKIEPAFYISENEDENFVEKSRKDIIDIKSYINYNEDEIITDGSHLVDGKLKPNVIYRTGGYDYIYCTDALGRICKAFTINLQLTKRRNRRKNNPNTPGKEIGDHAGHLIGDRFEGSPDIDNEVSQSKLVNLSEYKKIENKWAKALKQGKNVSVSIEVQYEGDSMRPSGFVIEYFIDGVKILKLLKINGGHLDGKVFEDLFMDIQEDMVCAGLDYVDSNADKIYIYGSCEGRMTMPDCFFEVDGDVYNRATLRTISDDYDVSGENQDICCEEYLKVLKKWRFYAKNMIDLCLQKLK